MGTRRGSSRRVWSSGAWRALPAVTAGALALGAVPALCAQPPAPRAFTIARRSAARASEHFACSGPKSATRPCYFSTPSGNIRCAWTPTTNTVTCELLATKRAYALRATGHAKAVKVTLTHRGETLPTNQLLSFPESLGCDSTNTTMFCGQAYGLGEFKLAPHGSHAA